MKHISIRLPWHDRGWDGCVCDNPLKNSYCKGLHSVNAELIRKNKDDNKEVQIKGLPFDEKWKYYPPCTETINVFGNGSVHHTHYPKSFIKNTSPKTVEIQPNSSGTWPFEDMWDEKGQRREPEERKEYVDNFFNELKDAGSAGLIFYYCNYDNPVSGDDKKYLLAGIARVKKIHPFKLWDDIPKDQKEKYGDYIWSRQIENDPDQRMRMPYQEYLKMGKDVNSIAVFAEGDISRSFKYVSNHVSDDNAISLIDKTIAAVKTVISQCYFDKKEIEQWNRKLEWLQSVRKECWISRGIYPGLSSVLKYLGMEKPEEFIRIRLKDYTMDGIKDYFFSRFEGDVKMSKDEKAMLEPPQERYLTMINSNNELEKLKGRLCKEKFPFFDFDDNQVKNILGDNRRDFSIYSSLGSIYDNPYIIAEEYIGSDVNDFINFEKIDHGMLPSEDLGDVERIRFDDPRRIRCLMHDLLSEASAEGHTFLGFITLAEKINYWHEQNDKSGLFHFDLTTWNQYKHIFASKVVEDNVDGILSIYLKYLHDAERKIRTEFITLINEEGILSVNTEWKKIINKNNTRPSEDQLDALEKLYTNRLSVLTGTAGTGKTTVISSLITGIKEKEPHHDFLLLAPTGKAALVMRDRINDPNVSVLTIHSFLMRNRWINYKNFTLQENGGQKHQVSTVIIDECSMIDVMLFATIMRAIDMNNIERLILVGDYNQLPPIGPGKIFYDLIEYLKKDISQRGKLLAELNYNWRQAEGSKASVLASHYAKVSEIPDEDIFTEISEGVYDIRNKKNKSDLIVDFWEDEEDLQNKIPEILDLAITRLGAGNTNITLSERYDLVHGIPFSNNHNIEAINFISPYRHTPAGVDNLNLVIQQTLRGKGNVDNYAKYGYVFKDKVLQIRNYKYYAYNHEIKLSESNDETYIPNGTLGFVFPKRNKKLQVKFPKDYSKYSYYLNSNQIREMLELGYATSVHKAQGSQFDITILILPKEDNDFLNREMLYTALTRSTQFQIILIQKDISVLKSRLWLGNSVIVRRNSSLFRTSKGILPKDYEKYKPENLIYEVLPDLFVRSEGERMISNALFEAGIGFNYEKPLNALDSKSFKLPDFTFKHRRKVYYWEHNGMYDNHDYKIRSDKKRKWYIANGYQDSLIETPIEGMNLTQSIKYVMENILNIK